MFERRIDRDAVVTALVFTPVFALAVALMSPGYFTPFGTVAGQVVLAGVGAAFIASLWGLQRLAEPASQGRLLAQVADPGGADSAQSPLVLAGTGGRAR